MKAIFSGGRVCLNLMSFTVAFCLFAQAAPTKKPSDAAKVVPRLSPVLVLKSGQTITNKSDWLIERQKLKSEWLRVLGLEIPVKRAPLKTEWGQTEDFPTFTRQYLKYQIEEGVFTDGYLLTPKHLKGKAPAIVVFHPTTALQAKGVAGLAPEYAEEKRQGLQLAERGYIVWCPRNFVFDEVPGIPDGIKLYTANVKKLQARHPKWTGMGRMVFDAVRAADFVESLPNVDGKNIGAIGHSLGGKEVFYAAAFDERYKAAVSSEGGIGLTFSNWEAEWYLGPQIKRADWKLENHQVLSLVAPRGFFLLAGDFADDDRSGAFIDAAQPVYKLFDSEKNLSWLNHRLGHRYAPQAREAAEKFLDAHLKSAH